MRRWVTLHCVVLTQVFWIEWEWRAQRERERYRKTGLLSCVWRNAPLPPSIPPSFLCCNFLSSPLLACWDIPETAELEKSTTVCVIGSAFIGEREVFLCEQTADKSTGGLSRFYGCKSKTSLRPDVLYNNSSYICPLILLKSKFGACITIKCVGGWICKFIGGPETMRKKKKYKKRTWERNTKQNILSTPWKEKWKRQLKGRKECFPLLSTYCLLQFFFSKKRRKRKQSNSGDKNGFLATEAMGWRGG